MEDTFLNAFNEATAQEKAAQKAQGATANINQQSYEQCINILQKYANGQVPEWNQKDINTLLKLLNDAGFSDKALQKINPILNNAKKQLQTSQSANPEKEVPSKVDSNKTQEVSKEETVVDNTTEQGNSGEGDATALDKYGRSKDLVVSDINRHITKYKVNVDDLIAYLQTLKK